MRELDTVKIVAATPYRQGLQALLAGNLAEKGGWMPF